jgi:hypothetical protein
MRISVAMCTFNGERFLAQQLASIQAQTRVPDEVVIRDDGSTDGTCRIVEDFARTFPGRIDVAVNPRRLGVTANFESVLAATTGDLILLCDQDDVWYPDRVQVAQAAFEADPSLLLCFADARLVDGSGRPLGVTELQALGFRADERRRIGSGRAFEVLSVRNLALGASTAFRRSLLADALPIPPSWVHDEWIAVIAAARGRIAHLDLPLIDYRQHGANTVGRPPLSLVELWAAVFRPKEDIRAGLIDRASALADRLATMGATDEHRALAIEKLVHARLRRRLPASRWRRLVPIVREALTGRYGRCSTGWRAMLVDLFGPIESVR